MGRPPRRPSPPAWRTLSGPASTAQRAVLAPEAQLLCKSADPRAKDEADFAQPPGF